jgi:hypothetical protein
MTPQELTNKVKEAFEANPEADMLFITADGQAFQRPGHAQSHANTLGKENPEFGIYTKVFRDQLDALDSAAEQAAEAIAEAVNEAAEEVTEELAAEEVAEEPAAEEVAEEPAPKKSSKKKSNK